MSIGSSVFQETQENPYREFTYTLASGASVKIDYAFSIFRVLSLTVGETIGVRFGDGGGETTWSGAGLSYKPPQILPSVTIRNTGAGSLDITVAMGIGDISDDRVNISAASGSIPVVVQGQTILNTKADVTLAASGAATQIITTNTRRGMAHISNNSASDYIRVGDSGVNATRGVRVPPNGIINIASTEAIYGASETAATPSVGIAWSEQ